MNFTKTGKYLVALRSYTTGAPRRFVPKSAYRTKFNESKEERTKLDPETVKILEKLSLVGKLTEQNIKIVEDAIAFVDLILQVDTKKAEPVYTVLEDWPLHVREDQAIQDACFYDIVKNAKKFEEDYFVAPMVNVPVDPKKAEKDGCP